MKSSPKSTPKTAKPVHSPTKPAVGVKAGAAKAKGTKASKVTRKKGDAELRGS